MFKAIMEFMPKAIFIALALVAFTPFVPASCGHLDGEVDIAESNNPPPFNAMAQTATYSIQNEMKLLGIWDENATWKTFNSQLGLKWKNPGGDWIDAKGYRQGNIPFSFVSLVDDDKPGPVELDVTSYYLRTGRTDFFLRRSGGTNFVFHSREALTNGPQLILDNSIILGAVADVALSASTVGSMGKAARLTTYQGFLLRFEIPANINPKKLALRLHSTGEKYGNQTLEVYEPASALRTTDRPGWLKNDTTVIASFDGTVMANQRLAKIFQNVATATMNSPDLTWMTKPMQIPGQTEACATVIGKIHRDFQPGSGGKFPGFANTGLAYPGLDSFNGANYPDSGWGGRSPDGIHWSARTGFGGWTSEHVALHTYFYAMAPHDAWGWADTINWPSPKGRWNAYIQCIKLNTVTSGTLTGNNDGELYYEIIDVGPVYSRSDIRWRDRDVPQSLIREFWIDYYCGGTSCGSAPRGTISFAKALITRGLPDMTMIKAEVDRLNTSHP